MDSEQCSYREKVQKHRQLLPVRWMAPEALKYAEFSSKSDVW